MEDSFTQYIRCDDYPTDGLSCVKKFTIFYKLL